LFKVLAEMLGTSTENHVQVLGKKFLKLIVFHKDFPSKKVHLMHNAEIIDILSPTD
jgi:hypothetical protein